MKLNWVPKRKWIFFKKHKSILNYLIDSKVWIKVGNRFSEGFGESCEG